MLSVAEALDLIRQSVVGLEPETVSLAESLGLTLAADIVSGLDSPPFDKALMDGFAVRSSDINGEAILLDVVEEVMAGSVPSKSVETGQAIQIMTGAPMPVGADAVVPIEQTEPADGQVTIRASVTAGASVLGQGASIRSGECVLKAGRVIRPQEVGLMAELGCHSVVVRRRPRVAILATGDELVPVHEKPGPGQIRNSNESMLTAQIDQAGGEPVPLGIAKDNREHLALGISLGLQADMLLLSGGVSAGKLDLVPSELASAGVREIFHKVNVKPGKPIWFGVLEAEGRTVPVFGLPGNPVSSMACFELFARMGLECLVQSESKKRSRWLPLQADASPNRSRPTYHPAKLVVCDGETSVATVDWVGSADLRCTVEADGMALLPAGDTVMPTGTVVEFLPW
jgi:molybdopterin molybdotransferase